MPRPRKAQSATPEPNESEAIATEPAAPEPVQRVKGYVPEPRWVRATAKWQDATDDSEPFSAEFNVAGLTTANTAWMYQPNLSVANLWQFFATRVRNWNALAPEATTGEWMPAPGPETEGWKAFAMVDLQITTYLVLLLHEAINGGDARAELLKASESRPASDDAAS